MLFQNVQFLQRFVVELLESRHLLSFTPGPEVTVANVDNGSMAVAVTDDGSYLIAADVVRGGVSRVTAFRYSAAGEQIGEPIPLYTYARVIAPNFHPARVAASTDADGDAVVAYNVFDGADSRVYVNRISRTGVVGTTIAVSGTLTAGYTPAVSMDAGGGFFVVWFDDAIANAAIMARAYDAAGMPRAPQFTLAKTPGIGVLGEFDIAARPDGSGAVFAAGKTLDGDSGFFLEVIEVGRTSTSGIVGTIEQIRETYDVSAPSVAVHADGSFVLGYDRIDRSRGGSVPPGSVPPVILAPYLQRFTPDGVETGQPFELGGSLPDDGIGGRSVWLDAVPGGGFVASFLQGTGDVGTAYAARFDAAGELDPSGYVPLVTHDVLGGSPDTRFQPKIGADARAGAVVAYATQSSVRFRRLSIDGGGDLRGSELFVNGTEESDHIIVERVRTSVFVNVNGIVERFDAAAVQFLSISGLGGDDDIINASAIPSTLSGGDGHDTLWGGTGADHLRGFGGNDSLRGGDGDDVLLGDTGNDTLHGGDGTDALTGASGDDALIFGEIFGEIVGDVPREGTAELRGSELFVTGTRFSEPITVERIGDELVVKISRTEQHFNAADVRFLSISGLDGDDDIANATDLPSTIHGGNGSDTMWGGIGPDSIRGHGGDDSLRGGDGDDLLLGDTGTDTLVGGDGTDTLTGGPGDDGLLSGEVLDLVVPGITFDEAARAGGGAMTVVGTDGDDHITLVRTVRSIQVTRNGLSTSLPPVTYVTLIGLAGNDTLTGDGETVDNLVGGPGSDVMSGGDGIYSDTVDYGSRTNGVSVSLDGVRNDGEPGENDLVLADVTGAIGGSGNDRITGNGERNILHGGGGNDTIDGVAGDDYLFGDDGDDELHAGPGQDRLHGGAGDDLLRADDAELFPTVTDDDLFGGDGNDRLFTDDGSPDQLHGQDGDDSADTDELDDVLEVETIS